MILLNKSKFWCVFAWNRGQCNHVNVTSTLKNVYILELGERDKGVIMNSQWFKKIISYLLLTKLYVYMHIMP